MSSRALGPLLLLVSACSNQERCDALRQQATQHATAGRPKDARALRDEVWKVCQDQATISQLDAAITSAESKAPVPPPKREPTFAELLDSKRQVRSALALVASHFGDTTTGDIDPGAAVFALWAAKYLRWSDLNSLTETKRALIMKDVVRERGKRLCTSGVISEIKIDRSVVPPVFNGGIVSNAGDVARFVAVGSTADIVENSNARFCGVVTGVQAFKNVYGNEVHSVFLVGMFDIHQNKPAPVVARAPRPAPATEEPNETPPQHDSSPPDWLQKAQTPQ